VPPSNAPAQRHDAYVRDLDADDAAPIRPPMTLTAEKEADPEAVMEVAAGLRPTGRTALLATALAVLLGVLAGRWVLDLYTTHWALGTVAGAAILTVVGIGIAWMAASARALRRLQERQSIRQILDQARRLDQGAGVHEALNRIALDLGDQAELTGALERWRQLASEDAGGANQIILFDDVVLTQADPLAFAAVRRAVRQSFALIALSPTALTDTVLFLSRLMAMIRQVSAAYGLPPSNAAARQLARRLVREAALIATTELAADALTTLLGESLATRVSAAAADGAVGAYRMARLGLIVIDMCRPLPFAENKRPGLKTVSLRG